MKQFICSLWRGEKPFLTAVFTLVVAAAIGPMFMYGAMVAVLCLIDCGVWPWLFMWLGPVGFAALAAPFLIWGGVGAFRSTRHVRNPYRVAAQVLVISSVVWIPFLPWFTFISFIEAL